MSASPFDALAYFEKLKASGVPEEQARVQANALRDFSTLQDEKNRQELATKGDLRESSLLLQKDIEKFRAEIQKTKYDLPKWQIGIAIALCLVMAKGFGWIGF